MNKKVKMVALGAAGAAGLVAMPVAAHAAPAAPAWRNCTYYGNGVRAAGWNGPLYGNIIHSGTCVWQQGARLSKMQDGLTERTRFWSGSTLLRTTWQAGYQDSGYTFFSSTPDMFAGQVCEALVANSDHSRVIYGPVCENA